MVKTIIETSFNNHLFLNIWFWLFIMETIILLILLSRKKKREKDTLFQTAINLSKNEEKESMNNVVNSIFKSKQLYDELKKKCHPDRFLDKERNAIANELFQELTKNKANYDALRKIKERAVNELKIT